MQHWSKCSWLCAGSTSLRATSMMKMPRITCVELFMGTTFCSPSLYCPYYACIQSSDTSKLTGSGLSAKQLAFVTMLSGIQSLMLADNMLLDDTTMEAIAQSCRGLQTLDVSGCKLVRLRRIGTCSLIVLTAILQFGDSSLLAVARFCQFICTIILRGCSLVTDRGMKQLACRAGSSFTSTSLAAQA